MSSSNQNKSLMLCLCILRLQSQIDDKDRTIKIQQNQIDKLEKDVVKLVAGTEPQPAQIVDTTNTATQTDRVSFF